MKYSNAKIGFKRLFTAEMLMILAEIVAFFVINVWWLMFVAALMIIISFFMNLSGLRMISKDDEGYSKAYIWAIIGIVITIVGAIVLFILDKNGTAYKYCSAILKVGPKIADYLSIYYVISASINVAKSIKDIDLAVCAKSTLSLHLVVYAISILLSIIINFSNTLIIVIPTIILALIESVLAIVAKIKYYIFLKRMADSL